jgi:hypothetical protein
LGLQDVYPGVPLFLGYHFALILPHAPPTDRIFPSEQRRRY